MSKTKIPISQVVLKQKPTTAYNSTLKEAILKIFIKEKGYALSCGYVAEAVNNDYYQTFRALQYFLRKGVILAAKHKNEFLYWLNE